MNELLRSLCGFAALRPFNASGQALREGQKRPFQMAA
jgi:hypothetical protein